MPCLVPVPVVRCLPLAVAFTVTLKPGELVIPNTHGLPYIRLDDGPMKGGSAGIRSRLREVAGVERVSMRDLRHYFA